MMLSRTAWLVVVLLLAAALAPVALPWLKTPVILALANGLAVLGVIVLVRAGQVSFGHAMFFCFAGYAVAFGQRLWHLDALLLLPLGVVGGTVFGALVGLFVVRYRGIFFGMLNLAFSMMLFAVLGKFSSVTTVPTACASTGPPSPAWRSSATPSRPCCCSRRCSPRLSRASS